MQFYQECTTLLDTLETVLETQWLVDCTTLLSPTRPETPPNARPLPSTEEVFAELHLSQTNAEPIAPFKVVLVQKLPKFKDLHSTEPTVVSNVHMSTISQATTRSQLPRPETPFNVVCTTALSHPFSETSQVDTHIVLMPLH